MKSKAAVVAGLILSALIFAVGFDLGAKSVKFSPSESIELSGLIMKGIPATKPVRM